MCGIVGMAGNLNTTHNQMFRDMLVFDVVRGVDSTGVVHVDGQKKVRYDKSVGLPDQLWGYKDSFMNYKGVFDRFGMAYIGHNRAATQGKVTNLNAHPFDFPNVIGVHNGSLISTKGLHDEEICDVDSEAIYSHINEHGIDDTWAILHGAAALCWWDKKQSSLNFIRNMERPLVYATNEAENAIFWASEGWMIQVAASRNSIKLKNKEDGTPAIWLITPHKLFTIYPTVMNYKMETRVLKSRPITTVGTTTGNDWMDIYGTNYYGSKDSSKTTVPATSTIKTVGSSRVITNTQKQKNLVRRRLRLEGENKINSDWAKECEKGEKDSKGVIFRINGSKDTYLVGEIVWPENNRHIIKIFPKTFEEFTNAVEQYEGGDDLFISTARMRRFNLSPGQLGHYRIQTDHIKVASERDLQGKGLDFIPFEVDEEVFTKSSIVEDSQKKSILNKGKSGETNISKMYRGPHGRMISYTGIIEALQKHRNTCFGCDNLVLSQDAEDLKWFGDKFFCHGCQEDQLLMETVFNTL
jgi:hypothetical protein